MLHRIRKTWSDFCRATRGAVAIEFALLCWPFFLIVFGIIELSFVIGSAAMVESATLSAARMVVTGQMDPTAGDGALIANFKTEICENQGAGTLIRNCTDRLFVSSMLVTSFIDFRDNPEDYAVDADDEVFVPGGPDDIIVIRVQYDHQLMTPVIQNIMGGTNGTMTFMTTVATQNEPFGG